MKRLIFPAVLLLLASGCRSTDSIEQLQSGRRSDCDAVTILAPLSNDLTRTTLGQSGDDYVIYWKEADEIGVFSEYTKNSEFTLEKEIGGSTVAFKGLLSGAPTCAYYPYSESAGSNPEAIILTLPATQEQTGSGNPNMAYDLKSGQSTGGNAQSGYTFTFQQKLTLLQFILIPDATLAGDQLQSITLSAPEGKKLAGNYTLNITDDEAVPTFGQGASNQVTVKFNDKPVLNSTNASTNAVVGYVFINPDIKENDALTITIDTDKHVVVTKTAKASSDFELGVIYEIGLDIDDLASKEKIDILTKESWENVTAPGYYTLDNGVATAIHQYEACKDQYTYSTSGDNYSFTIQSMKKGKLSRLTVNKNEINSGATSTSLNATLYTIHGSEGAVSENGTWTIVENVGNKYWLENSDHTKGFILLVEED